MRLFTEPNVSSEMDIVDISKEVFALADFYSGINYSNPLRDPRVHPVVQDGRFFLQASPQQYDIISGEPPPPKVAGSVNLYTAGIFLTDEWPTEGRRDRHFLAADQSAEGR